MRIRDRISTIIEVVNKRRRFWIIPSRYSDGFTYQKIVKDFFNNKSKNTDNEY